MTSPKLEKLPVHTHAICVFMLDAHMIAYPRCIPSFLFHLPMQSRMQEVEAERDGLRQTASTASTEQQRAQTLQSQLHEVMHGCSAV